MDRHSWEMKMSREHFECVIIINIYFLWIYNANGPYDDDVLGNE